MINGSGEGGLQGPPGKGRKMKGIVYTIQTVELTERLSGLKISTFQYADYCDSNIDRYAFNYFNARPELILIRVFNQNEDVVSKYSRVK